MTLNQLIIRADFLLEALPYIQRYRGETFVIKYGGSFMDAKDPEQRDSVARDITFLEAVGINPVVVHGGGKAITRALKDSGIETRFIQGMRVTDQQTMNVVEKVLSYEINPRIVETIQSFGGKAKGFAGSKVLKCKKKLVPGENGEMLDVGFVGEVNGVDTVQILDCIANNITPVISPTAQDEEGNFYNCNADIAAAQVAIALKARRLVFMSDVPGLMRDLKDPTSLISQVQVSEVDGLKKNGVIDAGMIPKMDSAVEAIRAGVEKVSLVDGRMPHSVMLEIFTHAGVGTELVL
ncbi:MAG: acetylglutamate kinase [Verrucomicrobia bacterium]|nr:acetylglutamate kinase [Verrucomicrobiota bacterium]MBR5690370.1 acetylglutamate kinase [Verrucomicrobiota bacterium]MBR5978528.1 acetylglutamate kinase [Verrucomicrobiota bacterium]